MKEDGEEERDAILRMKGVCFIESLCEGFYGNNSRKGSSYAATLSRITSTIMRTFLLRGSFSVAVRLRSVSDAASRSNYNWLLSRISIRCWKDEEAGNDDEEL